MKKTIIYFTFFILCIYKVTYACTGMQIMTKDNQIINGRTVEFAVPITLKKAFVPRDYKFVSQLDDKTYGLSYKSKYAFIGATTFDDVNVVDGINEKGLSVGAFYFTGYSVYTNYKTQKNTKNSLSPSQFTNWILSQFDNLDDIKKNIKNVTIVNAIPKGWPISPPFHYIVYDKSGKSIVIEPLKEGLIAYDNPTGVLTNSPTFSWQLTNLKNYIGLSNTSPKPLSLGDEQLNPFGQGTGLRGLPGDFTPPSRFIRAVVFSQYATPAPNLHDGINQLFHLLHQFDIPVGSVASVENGKTLYDYTLATIVRDPQNIVLYFVTYDKPFTVQSIKLSDYKLDSNKITTSTIEGVEPYFTK